MQRANFLSTGLPALRRGLQLVLNAMAAVGTLWVFAIMMLIVADVVGRNFLATPIIGVAEISARSVVAIVFLLLPPAALNGMLIRSDFLMRGLQRLLPGEARLLDGLFALAGVFTFVKTSKVHADVRSAMGLEHGDGHARVARVVHELPTRG